MSSGFDSRVPAKAVGLGHTLTSVSVVPNPEEPTGLTVLPPEEALRRAKPLPTDDEMSIEGLADDEWNTFEKALTDQ